MTTENVLINKSFYQTIIDKNEREHPIKILGEMYIEEMQKERPNLSSIRFAQGEVYFSNNDYEAAIYKWQHPFDGELISWAQKNIADAHLEMGLLEHAERFYKEVDSSSVALNSEVLLQLFSLYIQRGNQEKAVDTIKKAVSLNPAYSRVTEIARTYFEDINEWDLAIELAVNEALRTQSLSWFEILSEYIEHGLIRDYNPNYFSELLASLLQIDMHHFENLTEVFWNSYKQNDFYLEWLETINKILLNQPKEPSYMWKKLPILFKETYYELINGNFLLKDISGVMENHVTNWLNISSESDSFISSTAILAWNEMFPAGLDARLIGEAEHHFERSIPEQKNDREDGIKLFESIKLWAEREGLSEELTKITDPLLEEYNVEVASPSKIRNLIDTSIVFLLEQRVELENAVQEDINWNGELLTRLHEIQDQLGDAEKEKVTALTNSFHTMKNTLTQNVISKLPKLLRNCSELVLEDSDYSRLHTEINDEMNRRIAAYMQNYVKYDVKQAIQEWMDECEGELREVQTICDELSENVNHIFDEEKIALNGDFKVLDDWQRDLERISRGLQRVEKVNILMRNNPSQLLLKGAGKLFGSISKNKEMLHNRYKSYIENADYTQIAREIIAPFSQQLELFEGSIDWDVNRFFSGPVDLLNRQMEEVQEDIARLTETLNAMQSNPETYRDPLTFFELKLRQYELMNTVG